MAESKMNLKAFIKSLKDYEWTIKRDAIRSDTNDERINCCPLTVKENQTEDMYGECGERLGLPEPVCIAVVEAADYTVKQLKLRDKAYSRTDSSNLIELRRILIRELGLKEKEEKQEEENLE